MPKLAFLLLLVACGSTQKPAPCPVCPAPPAPEAAPVTERATEPAPPADGGEAPEKKLPPGVELSVTAEKNLEKAREALAKKDLPAARAYFEFTMERFPLSAFFHDAELGLIEVAMLEQPVIGSEYDTAGYCHFIEHHPFHPLVVNGEVGCRIAKAQAPKEACDPKKQIVPAKYCSLDYCKHPAGAKRPECKAAKP